MKLLLFGGTFDPPHSGHMNNLRAAIDAVQPDRVVVMPAGTPPHKTASATPAALRLAMCACFRAVAPGLTVSDWEIRREGRSYTIHTLEMLAEAHPGARLYLTMGSDMLLGFEKWYRWQDILARAVLVVQSREPGDDETLRAQAAHLQAFGGRVLFARAPALECASSAIRAGADTAGLLPAPVPAIIERYGLYKGGETA